MQSQALDMIDKCTECHLRSTNFFCNFAAETVRAFDAITSSHLYPKGAALFVEGQPPRGVYVLCQGRLKLSICSSDGKTMILGIVEPGEIVGLNATVSNTRYGVTAEALEPSQANFVKREDLLNFLANHKDATLNVTKHLSRHYQNAYVQLRSLGLSQSVREKLAKLLLDWSAAGGEMTINGLRFKRILTHEEIAGMIGTTRETVSRTFGDLAGRKIINVNGATLTIRNRVALQALAGV
jgi:CRP/FNR family transcriptional regulator, cyclic AMP receptor protein